MTKTCTQIRYNVRWREYDYRPWWKRTLFPSGNPFKEREFSSREDAEWFYNYMRIVRYCFRDKIYIDKVTTEFEDK